MRHPDRTYYSARAAEYERIYDKPERQRELQQLRQALPGRFAGKAVLEIACGTGYWTQFIAAAAREVCATDLSEEVLAIARTKPLDRGRVTFQMADAMNLPPWLGTFDAAFCGFWWSHIPLASADAFLDGLHSHLQPGSVVVMLDNLYVEGSSTPISRRSRGGDTFQIRGLEDGSTYEVLKNFPSEDDLRIRFRDRGSDFNYAAGDYYWLLSYLTAA
ncbi:MAG TPA: class I SAM-dependent methyltransferase [Steroidobacteraceae bacterium]|nr:class I SAM-dependent methyltransferase [Steroidobacteraceae bacterium]